MSSGATYDANGDVLTDSLHSYAWDVETRPTTIDTVQTKSGASTEIVYDAVGNKLALMSSTPTRTMYNDLAYAPFGEQYAPSGTTGVTNTSFAGNNQDTTTNLYDAQFREYEPYGRWPSPDPAGSAAANPANPQSWNRYAYVLNNPLKLIDPLGHDDVFSCWITVQQMYPITDPIFGPEQEAGCDGVVDFSNYGSSSGDGSGNASSGGNGLNSGNPPGHQPPACAPSGSAPSPGEYEVMAQQAQNGGLTYQAQIIGFYRGGPLDAQAEGASPSYANYVFGVYLAAQGFSLSNTLSIADTYGANFSTYTWTPTFQPDKTFTHIPAANVANITAGYNAETTGTLCTVSQN